MLKYFCNIILFLLLSFSAFSQTDTTEAPTRPKSVKSNSGQFRIGIDIVKPISAFVSGADPSYELEADYYLGKELYGVAEGGWGSASFDSSYLKYNSSNTFFRLGVNKSMLRRILPGDWDMVFIGARYGIAFIERSAASYTTSDPFWGNTTGIIPAKTFTAHWAELTGGVRVELFKGLFAGWNVRAKFLINKKPFEELPPSYVAGYGRGEKGSVFDFNFYLSYAIRWKKAPEPAVTVSPN